MESPDISDLVLRFGQPSNKIRECEAPPFLELPYGFIKMDLPRMLQEDQSAAVAAVLRFRYPDFVAQQASGNEEASFLLWIREQLKRIDEIERNFLQSEPDAEMLAAGVMRLNEFGAYATIDNLAGGDILKHAAIRAMPYFEVYQKLKLDKVQKEIEKAYRRILEERR